MHIISNIVRVLSAWCESLTQRTRRAFSLSHQTRIHFTLKRIADLFKSSPHLRERSFDASRDHRGHVSVLIKSNEREIIFHDRRVKRDKKKKERRKPFSTEVAAVSNVVGSSACPNSESVERKRKGIETCAVYKSIKCARTRRSLTSIALRNTKRVRSKRLVIENLKKTEMFAERNSIL